MTKERIDALAERLRPHYRRFLDARAEGEVLLTAHSHQAWPDASREGQLAAWDDAARWVDGKWSHVFESVLPEFRSHVAKRLGTKRPHDIAVAPNSHELVYRLSTCFPTDGTVVTTDAEFHSLARQLERLREEGLTVVTVDAEGPDFARRFVDAIDEHRPDWCALSEVLFTTSRRLVGVQEIAAACAERSLPLLLDAYHAFNVVELDVDALPGDVFVTGGGYKYAQSGEGACFMLVPADAERYRPVTTGWFADFSGLENRTTGRVGYGAGGDRFFGATFDPTSYYRAVYTYRFMDEVGLDVATLSDAARLRTALVIESFDRWVDPAAGITLASPRDAAQRGGFVALRTERAGALREALGARGIRTDHRKELLRLGPAPYTTSEEIERAVRTLADVA